MAYATIVYHLQNDVGSRMNSPEDTDAVHSSRGVFSILIALAVLFLVGISVSLLIGAATVAGQGMSAGIAIVGILILLGVLAIATLLSVVGLALGWTAYGDPACKKLLPVLGLVFNGMALLVIVPGALWLGWILTNRS